MLSHFVFDIFNFGMYNACNKNYNTNDHADHNCSCIIFHFFGLYFLNFCLLTFFMVFLFLVFLFLEFFLYRGTVGCTVMNSLYSHRFLTVRIWKEKMPFYDYSLWRWQKTLLRLIDAEFILETVLNTSHIVTYYHYYAWFIFTNNTAL